MIRFDHFNFNVQDMARSLAFYDEALGLTPEREKDAQDGSYRIVFLRDREGSPFRLELTWLRDHPQPYDLGEEEYHLAFVTDEYDDYHARHEAMGCICFENPAMGIYFIQDPDGYWIEIVPKRN